ncbi:MAG: hypothetical protein ABFD54_15150 [Armatimonadota bacterium]|nr:hypothetical protein [bacterium]
MRLSTFIVYVSVLVCLAKLPASASNYSIEQIYTVHGSSSIALDISNNGQIIGSSGTGSGNTGAFFWSRETGYVDIWSSTGVSFDPVAINDAGQIIGRITSEWTTPAALWYSENGAISPMDLHDVYSINSAGIVLGVSDTGNTVLLDNNKHSTTELTGAFEGIISCGNLNNSGQAVITTIWTDSGPGWAIAGCTAYRWDSANGIAVQLDSPFDENNAYVNAINDHGYAVGISGNHAVMWNPDGSVVDLGEGSAWDINNLGQIVGSSREYGAVLWQSDGTIVNLPDTTDSDDSWALAINDAGWIVGQDGANAVLWQPVPEPSAFAALACGLVGIFTRTRKRRSS